MANNPITDTLREISGLEDLPDGDLSQIIAFLSERYGGPEVSPDGPDREAVVFALPDRELRLLRSPVTGALLGILVFAQAVPPACPTPGPVPATLTVVGTATVNYRFSTGSALGQALGQAAAALIPSYTFQSTLLCRNCPPACRCQPFIAGLPRIQIFHFIRWRGWVPIGQGITVIITVPIGANCV